MNLLHACVVVLALSSCAFRGAERNVGILRLRDSSGVVRFEISGGNDPWAIRLCDSRGAYRLNLQGAGRSTMQLMGDKQDVGVELWAEGRSAGFVIGPSSTCVLDVGEETRLSVGETILAARQDGVGLAITRKEKEVRVIATDESAGCLTGGIIIGARSSGAVVNLGAYLPANGPKCELVSEFDNGSAGCILGGCVMVNGKHRAGFEMLEEGMKTKVVFVVNNDGSVGESCVSHSGDVVRDLKGR